MIVAGFFVLKGAGVFSLKSDRASAQQVPASVFVTAPTGGETFDVGQRTDITFDATGTIDHFRISLSTDSGGTFPTIVTASTPGSPYSWTVNDLPTATARIRVEALDATNALLAFHVPDSDFTIAAQGDATPPVPGASGAITSANIGLHGLDLNWTRATDDVTAQAGLRYEVRQSSNPDIATVAEAEANGAIIGAYGADIGSFSVTGLASATTYYFNVIVKDAAGNKAIYTTLKSATTADTVPPTPGAAGLISATSISTHDLTLHWTSASDGESAPANLLYEVRQSSSANIGSVAEAEANGAVIKPFAAGLSSFAVTGLAPVTTYYFNVIVQDEAGNKAAYVMQAETTPRDTSAPIPGAAGGITFSNVSQRSLNVNWAKAADDISAQAKLQYELRESATDDIGTVADAEANGSIALPYAADIATTNVKGLTPATTYFYNVIVKDEAGNKAAYVTKSATMLADTTPPVPGNAGLLAVSGIGPTSLTLTWTKSIDDVTAESALKYEVRQSSADDIGTLALAEANGTVINSFANDLATFGVTGLTPATTYHFNVIVQDEAGNKSVYASVAGTTIAQGGGGGGGGGGGTTGGGSTLGPAIRLVSPSGGERIAAGSAFSVVWRPQGSDVRAVRISTSTDGGATWSTVTDSADPFSGHFSWNVPGTAAASVILKVEELGRAGTVLASDISRASFAITPVVTPFPVTGLEPGPAIVDVIVHLGVNATTLEFPEVQPMPKPGDTVMYRIDVIDEGGAPAPAIRVTDVLPGNTSYVPASLAVGGVAFSDALDGDPASFDPAGGVGRFELGTLSPGMHAVASLKTRVLPGARVITNQVILESDGQILKSSTQGTNVAAVTTGTIAVPPKILPPAKTPPPTPATPTVPAVLPVTGSPPAPAPVTPPEAPPTPAPAPSAAPPAAVPSAPSNSPNLLGFVIRDDANIEATPILDAVVTTVKDVPALGTIAEDLRSIVKAVRRNRIVQAGNTFVVTPLVLIAAAAATIISVGVVGLASYAMFIFTQPFALLDRRKGKAYGTVFNRGTRMPIDLAIVRLVDPVTDRPVASRVTDRFGRYLFLVKPGTYEIEARKPGVYFPPSIALGSKEGPYADLYPGGEFGTPSGIVAKNVPMDVADQEPDPANIMRNDARARRVWRTVSFGPMLALVEYAATPRSPQALALLAHLLLLLLFIRLARPPRPKSFGTVTDEAGRSLKNVIVRVVESAYDRILDSQLTDAKGRYAFLVGQNTYYLRFEKPGYETTSTEPIDYSAKSEPSVIDRNFTLKTSKLAPPSALPQP